MDKTMDLRKHDALIIVDVQRDFCPGGSLAITGGDQVIPVLNRWIEKAATAGAPIFASRDWHPKGHLSFRSAGGPWPEHCVQGTEGAAFHSDLHLPANVNIVTKGNRADKDQYSAFDDTGLAAELARLGVKRVFIVGLALDICVRATALDAKRAGLETVLIASAARPVTPEGGEAALKEMREAGIEIVDS